MAKSRDKQPYETPAASVSGEGTDLPCKLQKSYAVWEPQRYDSHPWASCCSLWRLSLIRYLCWTYRVCRRSIKIRKNYLSLVFCILGKNTVCHHQVKTLNFFCPTTSNWKFYLYNIPRLSPCVPIICVALFQVVVTLYLDPSCGPNTSLSSFLKSSSTLVVTPELFWGSRLPTR